LNIGPYLADSPRDEIYSLKGVILHSGTAQRGHYSSLVRIGEKWIRFNDIEVSELREEEFEEVTFGSSTPAARDDYDTATSAYLLFYIKRGATALNLSFDTEPSVLEKCDPLFVAEIERENEEFRKIQAVFSESTFDFVTETSDLRTILMYLLNVLCHSSMSVKCHLMKQCFLKFVQGDTVSEILQYFTEHFTSVSNILEHCGGTEMIAMFCDCLNQVMEIGKLDEVFTFLQKIFELLPGALAVSWRQVTTVAKCLWGPINAQRDLVGLAVNAGWVDSLVSFIGSVYGSLQSNVV
jgi:hypothetical protein